MGITNFKGNTTIGNISMTEAVEINLVSYIDWCFLELGAFFNITIPSSGAYGGDRHRLRCVDDPRYNLGQVWEAYRSSWVWESGLTRATTQPIQISGVFVNNTFLPRSSGYYIDYHNGQVVFDTEIDATSVVKLEYAHKWVNVVESAEVPWFREGQTRSFRVDDDKFLANSGIWNNLSETRLQLPLVAIEVTDKAYQGYQLGGGQWSRPQVVLHVLGEDPAITKRIASILSEQNESTIYMFDPDKMMTENKYPLDYRGDLNTNPLCYPDLVADTGNGGCRYNSRVQHGKIRIYDSHEQNHGQLTANIFHSTVRWNTEVILPGI